MSKVIKSPATTQQITKETMELVEKEKEFEKGEITLPESILPNERCKLTISTTTQKEPKLVFYSIVC